MSATLTVEYREVVIRFSEDSDKWQFEVGGERQEFEGLKAAKRAVDVLSKRQYVPIPVFYVQEPRSYSRDGAPEIQQGTVTRPGQVRGSYRYVSDKDNGRAWEQVYQGSLFLRTSENQQLLPQYVDACVQAKKFQIEAQRIRKAMAEVPAEMEMVK